MKLQVFGSYGADTLEKVISSTCGKRVTAVILDSTHDIEDITMTYKRAVAADPYNAKILRQLDLYRDIHNQLLTDDGDLSSSSLSCILCNGRILCPFCQLKNDFRDILLPHGNPEKNSSTTMGPHYLEDIISALLKAD
jgi:hypothetical protein